MTTLAATVHHLSSKFQQDMFIIRRFRALGVQRALPALPPDARQLLQPPLSPRPPGIPIAHRLFFSRSNRTYAVPLPGRAGAQRGGNRLRPQKPDRGQRVGRKKQERRMGQNEGFAEASGPCSTLTSPKWMPPCRPSIRAWVRPSPNLRIIVLLRKRIISRY